MPAAVPQYVGTSFNDAPPGHRFRLYFDGWDHHSWRLNRTGRDRMVGRALPLPREALGALSARQDRLAASGRADVISIDARTEAPFVTGMGMEHPLETGFAFLDPHGLPYLPGSSVKGVR
ncbi:MAG: RAMP superfamily CRISPR-associated protein [Acidobacteriota bacterium]